MRGWAIVPSGYARRERTHVYGLAFTAHPVTVGRTLATAATSDCGPVTVSPFWTVTMTSDRARLKRRGVTWLGWATTPMTSRKCGHLPAAGTCMSVFAVGCRGTGDDSRQTSGLVSLRYGPAAYVAAPPSVTDAGSYQLVGGDLRQLPRLEVADVLPHAGKPGYRQGRRCSRGDSGDGSELARRGASAGARGHYSGATAATVTPRAAKQRRRLWPAASTLGYRSGPSSDCFRPDPAAGKFAELHGQEPSAGYRVSAAHVGECRQVDGGASLGRAQAGVSGGAMGAVNAVAGSDGPHRPCGLSGARADGVHGGQAGI